MVSEEVVGQIPGSWGTIELMSMMSPATPPKVPTMPSGEPIATYSTYLAAQKAVDSLSDEGFDVRNVTIVGHDLHMVERVTGRLTYPRVAAAGFASGAWFGLFVGLLLSLFSPDGTGLAIFAAIMIGGAFGLLFSVLSYALTGGKRDFTSQSQIVAARYVLLCSGEISGQALQLLRSKGNAGDLGALSPTQRASTTPAGDTSGPPVTPTNSPQAPAVPVDTPEAASEPAGPPRTYGEAIDAARRQQAATQRARSASTAPSADTVSDDVTPAEHSEASERGTGDPEVQAPNNPFRAP